MRERPILFSGAMVCAILDGRKTETRRVVRPQPPAVEHIVSLCGAGYFLDTDDPNPPWWQVIGPVWAVKRHLRTDKAPRWRCPYGATGDVLWVREAFAYLTEVPDDAGLLEVAHCAGFGGDADGHRDLGIRWLPSIHMPRWACRLRLRVLEVRVERLQEITQEGARAEGATLGGSPHPGVPPADTYRAAFSDLWDGINAKRGFAWADDPWVWVVRFKRLP